MWKKIKTFRNVESILPLNICYLSANVNISECTIETNELHFRQFVLIISLHNAFVQFRYIWNNTALPKNPRSWLQSVSSSFYKWIVRPSAQSPERPLPPHTAVIITVLTVTERLIILNDSQQKCVCSSRLLSFRLFRIRHNVFIC